jgi:hypothetical protein
VRGIALVLLLASCGAPLEPVDPPAPPPPCELTAYDRAHGIGRAECSPGVYACFGELEIPAGGCVVYGETCVTACP